MNLGVILWKCNFGKFSSTAACVLYAGLLFYVDMFILKHDHHPPSLLTC